MHGPCCCPADGNSARTSIRRERKLVFLEMVAAGVTFGSGAAPQGHSVGECCRHYVRGGQCPPFVTGQVDERRVAIQKIGFYSQTQATAIVSPFVEPKIGALSFVSPHLPDIAGQPVSRSQDCIIRILRAHSSHPLAQSASSICTRWRRAKHCLNPTGFISK